MPTRWPAWLGCAATCPQPQLRNGAEAVKLAERACHLSGDKEPITFDVLAAAYAEAGLFPEAVRTARKALVVAKQQHRETLAENVEARMRLYQAKTPYRQPSRPHAEIHPHDQMP